MQIHELLNFGTKIDLPTPFAQLELYKNRLSDVSAQVGGLRPVSHGSGKVYLGVSKHRGTPKS